MSISSHFIIYMVVTWLSCDEFKKFSFYIVIYFFPTFWGGFTIFIPEETTKAHAQWSYCLLLQIETERQYLRLNNQRNHFYILSLMILDYWNPKKIYTDYWFKTFEYSRNFRYTFLTTEKAWMDMQIWQKRGRKRRNSWKFLGKSSSGSIFLSGWMEL